MGAGPAEVVIFIAAEDVIIPPIDDTDGEINGVGFVVDTKAEEEEDVVGVSKVVEGIDVVEETAAGVVVTPVTMVEAEGAVIAPVAPMFWLIALLLLP